MGCTAHESYDQGVRREPQTVVLNRILRAGEGRVLRKLRDVADQVNALEEDFAGVSDAELRAETDKFKARLADGETLDDILPEAFAVVREAAKRTLGSGTSTSSSWAAPRCTSATSPR